MKIQIAYDKGYTLLKSNLQMFIQWDAHPQTGIELF